MSLPNPLFSGVTSISLSELAYYGEHPGVERYLAKFDSNLNAFKFANIARES